MTRAAIIIAWMERHLNWWRPRSRTLRAALRRKIVDTYARARGPKAMQATRLRRRRRLAQRSNPNACRNVLSFLCPGAKIGRCTLCGDSDCLFEIRLPVEDSFNRKRRVLVAETEVGDGLPGAAELDAGKPEEIGHEPNSIVGSDSATVEQARSGVISTPGPVDFHPLARWAVICGGVAAV